jgi:hypothetical protein
MVVGAAGGEPLLVGTPRCRLSRLQPRIHDHTSMMSCSNAIKASIKRSSGLDTVPAIVLRLFVSSASYLDVIVLCCQWK